MSTTFSKEAATSAISKMKSAADSQEQNADNYLKTLETTNEALQGAIAQKFIKSSNEHATNLKTQASNMSKLASDSDRVKDFFAELAERISSYRG